MTQIAYRLFIFLLIFSPLAFGTVEPWSLALMEITVFAALCLYLFALSMGRERPYKAPGLTPLLILLAYTALQLVPLPAGLVRFVSPATYDLYAETAGILAPVEWIPLSIHQKKTLVDFFRLSASVGFYYLTVQLLSDRERLKKTVFIVIIFAALVAIEALIQKFLSPDKIYWFRELPRNATPVGPYVYHNAFAGFMEMILPLTLCLFFYYRPRIDTGKSWRKRLADFFDQHRTNTHALLGFAAILMAVSVFISLSRGGIISLGLSTIFLLFFVLRKGAQKSRGVLALFIFVVTILGVGWFGWDDIFERFAGLRNLEGDIHNERLVYWQDSNEILADFPLTGTGFGTFRDIYPAFRNAPGQVVVEHAHNDYIELLTDGGIIAFLLAGWFLVGLIYRSSRAYSKRKERYSIYLFIGSLTGIVAILIHSITDFNLHIGANGLYFFFLAGLLVSAANTRMRPGLKSTMLKRTGSGVLRFFGLPAVTAILVFCLVFSSGSIMAGLSFSQVSDRVLNDTLGTDELAAMKDLAQKASFLDPLEGRYYFARANTETFLGNNEKAMDHYRQAVRRHPTNSELLQTTGLFLTGLGDRRAGDFLKAATWYEGNNPERFRRYGSWLLAAGRQEEGLAAMQRAIAMEQWKTNAYISLMVLHRLSDDEIRRALPKRMIPYLVFAEYLRDIGNVIMAERAYLDALRFMKGDNEIRSWPFHRVAGFYRALKRFDQALAVIQEAMKLFPADAGLKLTAGSLHEKLGNTFSAAEEYGKALSLDPQNKRAQKHLARLAAKKNKSEK